MIFTLEFILNFFMAVFINPDVWGGLCVERTNPDKIY